MKKPIPFGKYLLLERINVGGMAEVFLAKAFGADGFERLLAIKKILPTMVEDEEFITMFLDEARISVQLNHANVVQIHELGRQDENFYIAMDYVAGKDLRTILERYRRRNEVMPTAQAAYLAQRMAEGLDYAHKKKDARGMDLHIVHRDVSPQNILVSYDGEVKIIDFGIAKAANRAQKTQAGILKGKFGYMSPEQVRGLPIDRRSDIFALGVVLFEMLTGEKLFVGESDFSTLEKVRNAEVPSLKQYNSSIPSALEKIVMKALAREVEDRYQWAGELAEDLARILGNNGYAEPQLKQFMGEAFREDVMREQQRIESFADLKPPGEPPAAAPTRSPEPRTVPQPAPAPRPSNPARPPTQQPVSVGARSTLPARQAAPPSTPGRRTGAAPALDPVAAALAELDSPTLMPVSDAPPARPAPRVVTPPKPARSAPAPAPAPAEDFGDPNNPYIPPPSEEELAEMGTADRTVLHRPEFESGPQPKPGKGKPGLSLETVVKAGDDQPAPLERETQNEDEQPRGKKGRNDLRTAPPRPAQAPSEEAPTRARDPEPPADEFGDTGGYDAPPEDPPTYDEQAEVEHADEDQGHNPTARGQPAYADQDEPEPTSTARRRRGGRAPEPEPEPDLEAQDDGGYDTEEPPPEDDLDDVPQVAPAASGGKQKIGLMIGGGVLGVLLFAGLALGVYTVLSPKQGSITIKVEPPAKEASALIDGKRVPLAVGIPVANGDHEVSLVMPGQPEQKQTLTIKGGHPQEIHFQLQGVGEEKPTTAAPEQPAQKAEPAQPRPEPVAQKAEPAPQPEAIKTPEQPRPNSVEPAPQKPPQPAAEPKTFSVRVESDPPGAVILFGKKKGDAPLTVDGLDKNKSYTAEARLKGFRGAPVKVKYDGSASPMVVTVKLEAEAAKPVVERAERKERPEPEHKAAAKGSGQLICSSNPVAKIYVDGKSTNRFTPVPMSNPLKLPAGKHTIKFDDGQGKTASTTVTIEPDATARIIGINLQ